MAGRRSLLTLLTGIATAAAAIAQTPAPSDPTAKPEPPKRFFHPGTAEGDAMRERAMRELQKLTPEKRAELWRAVWTVMNLPADKRQLLLNMDEEHRKMAREEIERAISSNGLHLDEERKKAFVRRYFEERRTIEESLRREAEEKRRQLLGAMRERLKQEFGSTANAPAGAGGTK
jgi:hypothetical protein